MYRLLHEDERIEVGLSAKNTRSRKSINDYIENGSDEGFKSKYIACCKTLVGLDKFRKSSRARVAKITIEDESKIIDLTDPITQATHLKTEKAYNFSDKFQIVLLTGKIKPECLSIFEE